MTEASHAGLEFHPIADLFPLMPTEGEEWEDFVGDICKHGLRIPILLHSDGRILDGRNRYRACLQSSSLPITTTFEGTDEEALEEVISLNLHRRHLTESQRAMVAAKMANWNVGDNRYTTADGPPIGGPKITNAQAAERLNVSTRLVERARSVMRSAGPEVIRAIEAGSLSVGRAYDQAHDKKRIQPPDYRRDRVIVSEERDLIEAMDRGEMSPSAAYRELQDRINKLAVPRTYKPRKPIPIEDFVRELIRKISSVVRSGKLDSVVESKEFLTDYEKQDMAIALRSMAMKMLEKADELWPARETVVEA